MIIFSVAVNAASAVLLLAGLLAGAGTGTALLYAAVLCLLAAGALLAVGVARRTVVHTIQDEADPRPGPDVTGTGLAGTGPTEAGPSAMEPTATGPTGAGRPADDVSAPVSGQQPPAADDPNGIVVEVAAEHAPPAPGPRTPPPPTADEVPPPPAVRPAGPPVPADAGAAPRPTPGG